jgi:hypothetical protein
MHYSRVMKPDEIHDDEPLRQVQPLDSRIQLSTAWSFVDESMRPISFFGAGGGTR